MTGALWGGCGDIVSEVEQDFDKRLQTTDIICFGITCTGDDLTRNVP